MVMSSSNLAEDKKSGFAATIIRAGFYAENLLLYNKQAQTEGKLPLPIGDKHKFAPVALGDVALLAATVLAGEEKPKEGVVSARERGEMICVTGRSF